MDTLREQDKALIGQLLEMLTSLQKRMQQEVEKPKFQEDELEAQEYLDFRKELMLKEA